MLCLRLFLFLLQWLVIIQAVGHSPSLSSLLSLCPCFFSSFLAFQLSSFLSACCPGSWISWHGVSCTLCWWLECCTPSPGTCRVEQTWLILQPFVSLVHPREALKLVHALVSCQEWKESKVNTEKAQIPQELGTGSSASLTLLEYGVTWKNYARRAGTRPVCLHQLVTDSKFCLSYRASAHVAVQARFCRLDTGYTGSSYWHDYTGSSDK